MPPAKRRRVGDTNSLYAAALLNPKTGPLIGVPIQPEVETVKHRVRAEGTVIQYPTTQFNSAALPNLGQSGGFLAAGTNVGCDVMAIIPVDAMFNGQPAVAVYTPHPDAINLLNPTGTGQIMALAARQSTIHNLGANVNHLCVEYYAPGHAQGYPLNSPMMAFNPLGWGDKSYLWKFPVDSTQPSLLSPIGTTITSMADIPFEATVDVFNSQSTADWQFGAWKRIQFWQKQYITLQSPIDVSGNTAYEAMFQPQRLDPNGFAMPYKYLDRVTNKPTTQSWPVISNDHVGRPLPAYWTGLSPWINKFSLNGGSLCFTSGDVGLDMSIYESLTEAALTALGCGMMDIMNLPNPAGSAFYGYAAYDASTTIYSQMEGNDNLFARLVAQELRVYFNTSVQNRQGEIHTLTVPGHPDLRFWYPQKIYTHDKAKAYSAITCLEETPARILFAPQRTEETNFFPMTNFGGSSSYGWGVILLTGICGGDLKIGSLTPSLSVPVRISLYGIVEQFDNNEGTFTGISVLGPSIANQVVRVQATTGPNVSVGKIVSAAASITAGQQPHFARRN